LDSKVIDIKVQLLQLLKLVLQTTTVYRITKVLSLAFLLRSWCMTLLIFWWLT